MRETRIDDVTLRYDRTGTGPVALFLHGFPLDRSMWRAQCAALADLRSCVAPDLRGFGASDAPPDGALTMERHALDAVALLDALEVERADVVALSMGGYVALAMQELHPERIRSLALVDTRAGADDEAGRARRDAAAARLVEIGREAWAAEMIPALVGPRASVTVRARMRTMLEGTRYETIVAALEGMKVRPDRTGVLATIRVPARVVCGELDALTPPDLSRAMTEAIPGAQLTIVPGVGHMSPLESPDAVNAALRELWAS